MGASEVRRLIEGKQMAKNASGKSAKFFSSLRKRTLSLCVECPPREGNDRPTHLLLYYLSFPLTPKKKKHIRLILNRGGRGKRQKIRRKATTDAKGRKWKEGKGKRKKEGVDLKNR